MILKGRPQVVQPRLQHHKDLLHTSVRKTSGVRPFCVTLSDQPQYIPDLAPCELHLLSQLKEEPRGHLCGSDDQVKTAVQLWFRHLDAQFYRDCSSKVRKRWRKCVWTTTVILWTNKCIEVKNKVQGSYPLGFYSIFIFLFYFLFNYTFSTPS
jgi:hypothetical protein